MAETQDDLTVELTLKGVAARPDAPQHFMRVQPVGAHVEVMAGEDQLISTDNAVWLQEVGKTLYPPVIYVPQDEIIVPLQKLEKQTHCPLKGDASYFALRGKEIGWAYESPFVFSNILQGFMAFWPDKVRLVITPEQA
ncbi:DUF427 domain-containing protein [Maritalea mediterranea]|uniref:DUF427 domain-containing protein n=1 Tax=Maritalea mediterranea TaxID=2909667 RepID=A0ABS9ECB2_9HYPH|nr:DUF427 domain-containing protein [Maritalea mediterranea]MCF4099524.1 DUF427 domain-containing protein [Maritalea mediterranea]